MGKALRAMVGYLKPYWSMLLVGQIAMFLGTAAALTFPWAVRSVFDVLFRGDVGQALLQAVGLLAVISLGQEFANYIKNYTLGHVGQKIVRDLRTQLYDKLLQLSLNYYDNRSSGEIASTMTNDINLVQQSLSTGLTYVIQQVVALIAVVALMLSLDPVLTLIIFCTMPLILLISQKMGERVKAISNSTQERLGYLMAMIHESLSGIDIIQAFVLESHARGMFRDENDAILNKSLESIKVSSSTGLVVGLLNAVFLLTVIGLGAYRVSGGHLSSSDLIAFILYSEMVAGPVALLAGIYLEINRALAAFQRLNAILETENDIQVKKPGIAPTPISGRIAFQDVSFAYADKPILNHITLDVAPGETVALVGPSGVGKSTLVKLLPRFYDPSAGNILLDGVDIRTLDLKALRQAIAIVPQQTYLFGFSIHDNIACGKPDATQEEIVEAARLANAHEFITEQARGYHTDIGEGGARLSGGQRQRLAIARAFLKDPRILILDEATSALDAHAEHKIQEALETLMRGRTTLIIAHRLSTIEKADKIVVLKEGEVLAVGKHRELLDSCAFYHDLYARQFEHATAANE